MSKSILQDEKVCYITGSTENLHKHHVYGASNRQNSERYGCFVWLRADWHNMSDHGVHFNKALDLSIKMECQRAFEERWSHEKFMEVFGRNYL